MRVLSNIAGEAVAFVDQAAGSWLARTGGGEPRGHEVAILRRLTLLSSAALLAVPGLLSTVTSPAVALPVGVATVAAAYLFSAVGSIALARMVPQDVPVAKSEGSADAALVDACAGLVLFFDPQGGVTATGGRERDAFLSWMRNPVGRGFVEQIHVSDRIAFLQALDELRQGEAAAAIDLRLERPAASASAGQFVFTRMDMTAIRNGQGGLSAVLGQLRDTTEEQRLRAEAALKTTEAETANDAKSRFLAAVSHELRTPLNAILGFSDILTGEYFGRLENDRQREYVKLIRQSGAHLLAVVNTMLDMSKIEAGRYELFLEAFPADEPVRACEAMLSLQAREKDVTLSTRIQRGLGEVVADQRALQQVLINLVGNAIKFTEPGGVVTVDAEAAGSDLRLTVSDTGIGIADDKLEMLGQPFMQIQNDYTRRYEGTGLGLSLVKGLVALHGGTFNIVSRPGQGTVISVTVPLNGSGASSTGTMPAGEKTVDFPPRLKAGAEIAEVQEEGSVDDQAKAKSA
ncbi:HAMP domain-containing histidine kinase [Rhizobiaceae bacterium n13]|uniref:histidine kinase n=1 Tax=Ferirhizobium litorale TaxID=2927786 RepID=A0AAE3U1B1_9HYPH|nr:HAMP domain-containing sensor histidine kinase [Fererhizobium litorale]MDI7861285.1 HAMP domain-containing histidine kinase [Fererhizobium litorale]MDI7921432.1 HAMP domain-containing histidine kinase [Fererhizobium litorale]